MGWFGKRKANDRTPDASPSPASDPPPDAPPEWAPYFGSLDRYDRFESAVRAYFKARGVRVLITDGVLTRPDSSQESGAMGLNNIAQFCAQSEEPQWPALIEKHFDRIERSQGERIQLEAMEQDYDEIAPRLAVRLHEPDHVQTVLDASVFREDVPGLVTMLCIDMPDTVHTVTRERAEKWRLSDEELFERAVANVDSLIDVNPEHVEVDPETKLWLLGGESIYNASVILLADRLKPFEGKHGGFVSIPTRSLALAIPFDDPSALKTVAMLMHFTEKFEQDGPGSLSRRVWWHRAGERIELPYAITDKGVEVHPPQAFAKVMEELA